MLLLRRYGWLLIFAPWILAAWLALAGCTPAVVAREGAPIAAVWPQHAAQCAAQPELDWCPHAR
jgi:hypothetical protein